MYLILITHLSIPGSRLLFHLKVLHFYPGYVADWSL